MFLPVQGQLINLDVTKRIVYIEDVSRPGYYGSEPIGIYRFEMIDHTSFDLQLNRTAYENLVSKIVTTPFN